MIDGRATSPLVPPSISDERGKAFDKVMARALADPEFRRLLFERIEDVDAGVLPFPVSETAQVSVQIQPSAAVSILQIENTPHITVDDLVTAAPANPADGQIYAIATSPTGLFAGRAGSLAERVSGTWIFRPAALLFGHPA